MKDVNVQQNRVVLRKECMAGGVLALYQMQSGGYQLCEIPGHPYMFDTVLGSHRLVIVLLCIVKHVT